MLLASSTGLGYNIKGTLEEGWEMGKGQND